MSLSEESDGILISRSIGARLPGIKHPIKDLLSLQSIFGSGLGLGSGLRLGLGQHLRNEAVSHASTEEGVDRPCIGKYLSVFHSFHESCSCRHVTFYR